MEVFIMDNAKTRYGELYNRINSIRDKAEQKNDELSKKYDAEVKEAYRTKTDQMLGATRTIRDSINYADCLKQQDLLKHHEDKERKQELENDRLERVTSFAYSLLGKYCERREQSLKKEEKSKQEKEKAIKHKEIDRKYRENMNWLDSIVGR